MGQLLESDKTKMNDVLASIRRAIDADIGGQGSEKTDLSSGRPSGFAGILGGKEKQSESEPPARHEGALVSREAELRTRAAFNRLSEGATRQAFGGRPIGDAARDYLRQAIKQWLDDNLPALAERLVREEIERVVRSGERR